MTATTAGYRALLVPAALDQPIRDIVIADNGDDGLADLRRHINCNYIEHVTGPRCSLWVDEEGAISAPPRPSNPRIDRLLHRTDGWSIRGNVVITGRTTADGETGSLPAEDAARLMQELAR
ncbi:DUF3846 domain-containing protein [Pseudonocardia sp. 73-21]|uniref:DUF3846 domain-containing protein n=1 Tax=Pseudonocardia sp. 73-21 TaxID=1895809 RepID=UPI00095955CC|nr:DUF3846 domain-containing protein [Pseudonocardia sp. 73-21]OJY47635.1 MAG: hypothetical protein BGP03_33420 [Pseudonocardia sp. 73-21]